MNPILEFVCDRRTGARNWKKSQDFGVHLLTLGHESDAILRLAALTEAEWHLEEALVQQALPDSGNGRGAANRLGETRFSQVIAQSHFRQEIPFKPIHARFDLHLERRLRVVLRRYGVADFFDSFGAIGVRGNRNHSAGFAHPMNHDAVFAKRRRRTTGEAKLSGRDVAPDIGAGRAADRMQKDPAAVDGLAVERNSPFHNRLAQASA